MPQRPFFFTFFLVFLLLADIMVAHGQALTVETDVIAATCGNNNGTLNVLVTGGQAPYTITVTGGAPPVNSNVTGASDMLTGLGVGTYTVQVKDNAGTTVVKNPAITNLPGPTNVLLGEEAAASCLNNDGSVGVTIVGGTAPYTFLYNGQSVGTTTALSAAGTATGLPSGNLTITVQDANGCTLPGTVFVDLDNNLTLDMDNAFAICEGTSRKIIVSSNATTFNWSPATGLSSATVEDPVITPTADITYTLVAGLGICGISGTLDVTFLPAPVADAGPNDTTCYGKDVYLQGSGGSIYMWTPSSGLNNPTIPDPLVIDPKASIIYSLSVTDVNGCTSLKPSSVHVIVHPPYQVFAGDDTSVMVGQTVSLNAVDVDGVGLNKYVWTPASGLSNAAVSDPTASFSSVGTYTYVVDATAPDGCGGSDSITIKVYALADIFVPNAFTPNGDGHNDVLRALCVSMRDFKYLTVFNRWGQQVFTTANAGVGWDGSFNGQQAPAGTYVWMVGGVDYSGRVVEKKGTVILIR